MNGTTVLLTAIGYVSFLFLIAWWGDGAGRRLLTGSRAATRGAARPASSGKDGLISLTTLENAREGRSIAIKLDA